jgi:hypothetical protein
MVLPIFENLFRQHETDIVFFRAFLVFLQIHSSVLIFIFQKTAPFRMLLITIYISTNRSDILKIVENSTKQPRLDCLSFFLDFVSATP